MEILCSFRLVLEGKTGIEIPEWSRLEFLEKILANTFALSDAEVTAPFCWIEEVYQIYLCWEDYLALCQKSWEPSFWELMDTFVLLVCMFGSFKNLACLNLTLDSEDLFCCYNWKKRFLWANGIVRFDLIHMMRDIFINSNLNSLTKFLTSSGST